LVDAIGLAAVLALSSTIALAQGGGGNGGGAAGGASASGATGTSGTSGNAGPSKGTLDEHLELYEGIAAWQLWVPEGIDGDRRCQSGK
jgi:hypothetical protein